jgi:uncharacterized protein
MRIVLFGATGNVGQRVIKEALRRGHEVVGVVCDPEMVLSPDPRVRLVHGDATDAASVATAASGADIVVSAVSPRPNSAGLPEPSLVDAARAIIAGLRQASVKRLLVVGGAGSLEVAPGKQFIDLPTFPEAYKAEALAQRDALQVLRAEAGDLDWTYLSPAAEIHPGRRSGEYRVTDDQLITDVQGRSTITFEDYAVALLDEIEQPKHTGRPFGVAY